MKTTSLFQPDKGAGVQFAPVNGSTQAGTALCTNKKTANKARTQKNAAICTNKKTNYANKNAAIANKTRTQAGSAIYANNKTANKARMQTNAAIYANNKTNYANKACIQPSNAIYANNKTNYTNKNIFNATKKGQSLSVDLVISMAIFMLLLAIAYLSWEHAITGEAENYSQMRADEAASRALRSISKSPGIPSSWASQGLNPDSASLLGIGAASSYNTIDEFKLAKLAAYFNSTIYSNKTKSLLGIQPFNADIRISYFNGTDISTMGSPPNSASIVLSSAQRVAIYKNESAIIRVRIWDIQAS